MTRTEPSFMYDSGRPSECVSNVPTGIEENRMDNRTRWVLSSYLDGSSESDSSIRTIFPPVSRSSNDSDPLDRRTTQ